MADLEYDYDGTVNDFDEMYRDFPAIKPGRITYGDLRRINEWEVRHGLSHCRRDEIDAYQGEGHGAAQAGLLMGMIDYGQASGEVD